MYFCLYMYIYIYINVYIHLYVYTSKYTHLRNLTMICRNSNSLLKVNINSDNLFFFIT